jgi:flagellar hook-associated protein FlgK
MLLSPAAVAHSRFNGTQAFTPGTPGWHVACQLCEKWRTFHRSGGLAVSNKLLVSFAVAMLAAAGAGCSTTDNANVNANANASVVVASDTTRPGPDGSEITTSVDANGVRTETRVFHNNPRVAKVVVTTRDGKRTTTVYAPNGESKDLKDDVGDALAATGNAIADGAGWLADKTVDIAGKTKEGAQTVGEKTGDVAKTVGQKTAASAKTVGEKTAEGAKKTGKAIKKAITP